MSQNFAKKKKFRADDLVVRAGLCETKSRAQSLIMAGSVVFRVASLNKDWALVPKAGAQMVEETEFQVTTEENKYVGRGALKLKKALEHWGEIQVLGARGLDIGSSTGGFTQVLLEKGALSVVALDVGTHQLHEKLRQDPRVVSIEQQHVLKTDENFWRANQILCPFDILVTDLSFISLTRIIGHCAPWLVSGGSWVLLVKPQFELDSSKVPRGIVRSEQHQQEAIDKVLACINLSESLVVRELIESPILGGDGNKEFLLWLQKK